MKYKKLINGLLAVAVSCSSIVIAANPGNTVTEIELIFDYDGGKRFVFELNQKTLDKSIWESDKQATALSPKPAAAIATKQLASLVPDVNKYEVNEIALEKADNLDHWYYQISFKNKKFDPGAVVNKEFPVFRIPVLLDGSIINPKVDMAAPYDTSGFFP